MSGDPGRASGSWTSRVATGAAFVVVVLVFAVALPSIADYGEVWEQVRAMDAFGITTVVLATLVDMVTYGMTWQAVLPGLGYRRSVEFTMVSTAVSNAVPLGGYVSVGTGYRMLREWGFPAPVVARSLVITGIWVQFFVVAYPLVSVLLLLGEHQRHRGLETAAAIGVVLLVVAIALFAAVMHSERRARSIGELAGRVASRAAALVGRGPFEGLGEQLVHFRAESVWLIRRRWLALTLAEIVGTLTVYAVLLATVRAVGIPASEIDAIEVLAAWSLSRLLSTIPITPGGLGFVELGLTGILTAFGGDPASVVAAVLVYRVLVLVPPLVLGGIFAFTWHRHHPSPDAVASASGLPPRPLSR